MASRPAGGQHNTLIGSSVFLRLSDVASGLPSYEEQVLLSTMDREPDGTGLSRRGARAPRRSPRPGTANALASSLRPRRVQYSNEELWMRGPQWSQLGLRWIHK